MPVTHYPVTSHMLPPPPNANPWLAARNILLTRPDNLGDVIMLSPALRALKAALPTARLTLLASTGGAAAAALLPWIDEVLPCRTVWQDLGHLAFDPQRELGLIETLREKQFDGAIIFTSFSQTPHVPGYLCYLAGIPLRVGEGKEFGGSVLSTELRGAPDALHQVERNLRLIAALGIPIPDRRIVIEISQAARAAVPRILGEAGLVADAPFILVHPGASALARRYPPERMGVVVRMLGEQGWPVLVTGVEREREAVETVRYHAPAAHYLLGNTDVSEYAALIEYAALVICGNTLPLHLADACLTPVIALYSGTDYEEQWRPRFTMSRVLRQPTPCHPCYLFICPIELPCLDIAPQEVVRVAHELLAEHQALQPPAGASL